MSTKLSDECRVEEVVIRGTTYKLRELTASEYDNIIKMASGPDDNADLATVLKMMTVTSIVEPAMTAEQLGDKPYPVYSKILQTVNKMHFGTDEETSPNA